MGLATIVKKKKAKEREIRILVLGLDNAGKSTVVQRWKTSDGSGLSKIPPTFGFLISTLTTAEGLLLNVWDIGGQKSIRAFWRNYFEETDGLVWVVDSTAPERFETCRQELGIVLQEQRLSGASLLILANKQDVQDAVSLEAISTALNLSKIGEKCDYRLAACSALAGQGIQESLDWLVADISRKLYGTSPKDQ